MGPARSRNAEKALADDTRRIWHAFLSERHLNASKTRDAVVEVFLETKDHVDLQSLHERTRRRHPGVGFATVYRTMKLLEQAGIAQVRHFSDARETLYEVATGRAHHDHLICERCGRIVEFVSDAVERLQEEIATQHGFAMSRHRHELYGLCSVCRAATSRPSRS